MPEALKPLLKVGRETVERATASEKALLRALEHDHVLAVRVERLATIPGIGLITALSWALEIGEVSRFASFKHAVSYCGLCSGENSSAGIQKRGPISKQRNKQHLQTVLIEAAKLAPRWNSDLALLYEEAARQSQPGHAGGGPQAGENTCSPSTVRKNISRRKEKGQALRSRGLISVYRMQQAQTRGLPGLALIGTGRTGAIRQGSLCLFRGWQANPNSIFGNGMFQVAKEICLRPQMDVWFCAPRSPRREHQRRLCPTLRFHQGGSSSTSTGQLRLPS